MTDVPHYDLDPVAQDIFDLMRRQPGDVFSPDALADELAYPPAEIAAALGQLLGLGFIEHSPAEAATFILSSSAPEL